MVPPGLSLDNPWPSAFCPALLGISRAAYLHLLPSLSRPAARAAAIATFVAQGERKKSEEASSLQPLLPIRGLGKTRGAMHPSLNEHPSILTKPDENPAP